MQIFVHLLLLLLNMHFQNYLGVHLIQSVVVVVDSVSLFLRVDMNLFFYLPKLCPYPITQYEDTVFWGVYWKFADVLYDPHLHYF